MDVSEESSLHKLQFALYHLRGTGFASIARRYFAANLFDGILTALGLVLGYYLAGGASASTLISSALAAGVGMGVSGFVGSLLVEVAERHKELLELEKLMLKKLHDTVFGNAYKLAALLTALVNALAPVAGSLTVVAPMLVADRIGFHTAVTVATLIGLIELVALGAYLARSSGASSFKYAVAMMCAGLAVIGLTLLLGG